MALNVIEGRVGEQERNFQERIDFVTRQKQRAVNQLQTANDAIENMMTFRKLDYDVAKDKYNTEFDQNIQMINLIKGVAEFEISEQERAQDTARANLQIIYNSIQDGSAKLDSLDAGAKAKISTMELQAGLPQGFFQTIQNTNPDSKVLSTSTRVSGGQKYADFILQNLEGPITTLPVSLGAIDGSGVDLTESELKRQAQSEMAQQLKSVSGSDGFVSPENYKKARNAWVGKGFNTQDFDSAFAPVYVNRAHYDDYGVSDEYFF